METLNRRCVAGCGRMLVGEVTWRRLPRGQRPLATHACHYGHDVCTGCMTRIEREDAGTRPRGWRGKALLEDWHDLRAEVVGLSFAEACRVLAPRFNRTPLALERALHRLGVRAAELDPTQARAA